MPGRDLPLLIAAATEAGQIARHYFGSDLPTRHKPNNAGPVTQADLEIDAMLSRDLCAARPGYGWLSEETTDDPARLSTERQFIVDPIDGTRAFIEGSKAFAIAIAAVRDGTPEASVVYLPALDLMFAAEAGQGATLNGAPIRASGCAALEGAEILATKPNMAPEHWQRLPQITRHFRSSLAYRLALVAQGRFDGMLTLRPSWEWDIAAGDLIAREAGASVSDRAGQRLRFNNPHPQVNGTLAAAPLVHAGLLSCLKPPS